jgi:hypothetical protein
MSHGSNPHQEPVDPLSIKAGHEVSDAMAKSLVLFTVYLTITLVVIVAISLGLFYMFTDTAQQENDTQYAASPLADQQPPSPAPPLQPSPGHLTMPYQDALALRAEYDRLSATYGNDMMADHAVHERIPVAAAMGILADQGIPENTAVDIPTPQGPGPSMPTPYSEGGRGSRSGVAAPPGIPQGPP